MTSDLLKRAVWLTAEQRTAVLEAATRAFATEGSNQDLCHSLIQEITLLEERISGLRSIVRSIVRGLRMPEDALPVYVCSAEVQQVFLYGHLTRELAELLDPTIPIPPIFPSPDKPRRARRAR